VNKWTLLVVGAVVTLGAITALIVKNETASPELTHEKEMGNRHDVPGDVVGLPSHTFEQAQVRTEASPAATLTPLPESNGNVAPIENPSQPSDSVFAEADSKEIEYAFELVLGKNSTIETAKNAAEVFERCLRQVPSQSRCYDGLKLAQQRQLPNWVAPVVHRSDVIIRNQLDRPQMKMERAQANEPLRVVPPTEKPLPMMKDGLK
jgi:hypothetical protein